MNKKTFKLILVLVMIMGIAFSISNFFPKKTNAAMTEELLHYYEVPGGYAFWCTPDGQGCYTVTPEQ